ncbi:MAG TPA: hypothetical protein VFQ83_01550 [Candidatus Udaeobacter sp.]|nr:hypothetical protein [Candidatus Udaeobacter sp.]
MQSAFHLRAQRSAFGRPGGNIAATPTGLADIACDDLQYFTRGSLLD